MAKKYIVQWTETANSDLYSIADYIHSDSPSNALSVLEKIEDLGNKLMHQPGRGRYVPELRRLDVYTYRELIIKPWRLIYRFDNDNVYILAVLDGRRNLQSILIERLIR